MPSVEFTNALRGHVDCPAEVLDGSTVRAVLDAYFERHPDVRGYVLDDGGAVRRHVTIFVNAVQLRDRARQSDPVAPTDELHVMQALSGG